jgi:hypothetical protein
MPQFNVVDSYARLTLTAERLQRSGQAVPVKLVQAIQAIESFANARFTPSQMRSAMQHVAQAKSRLVAEEYRAEKIKRHAKLEADAEAWTKRETQGMLGQANGLTRKQFQQLRDGKPVHFPSRRIADGKPEEVRRQTAALDKRGKGFTQKEWEERLDELADASDERFAMLAKQYNASPEELRKAAKRWETERVGFELQRRLTANDKGHTIEKPHEGEQLRAQIIDSMWKTDEETLSRLRPKQQQEYVEFATDSISQQSLDDKGMRGDIARAWSDSDAREEANGAEGTE